MDLLFKDGKVVAKRSDGSVTVEWKDIYSIDHSAPVVDICVTFTREDIVNLACL